MNAEYNVQTKITSKFRVAVLIACYNRKEKTIACLESLFLAQPNNWMLNIYLVDDGSNDGTSEAVKRLNSEIEIISGTGTWYWAHSMHQAGLAIDKPFDAILWLNDDTWLFPESLIQVELHRIAHSNAILVGQMQEPNTQEINYGGLVKYSRHPFHFKLITVKDKVKNVDSFNGNFVFIPKSIVDIIGQIDGGFAHAYADIDYGLRAKHSGVQILVVPGPMGECQANVTPPLVGIRKRFKHLLNPKSLPIKSQVRFLRRHGKWEWPIYIALPFIKLFFWSSSKQSS